MLNKKTLTLVFLLLFLTLLIGCLPGLTPPPPKGVISGRIMVPSSETTKDITGWIPVANATVTLTDSSGITHTVTTDEDGYYTFTNIAVNANTIITATAAIDGNTVIVKDVIPQAVSADEDYNAKTADAESTALALIVEELLEQEIDPEDIDLEEIQDSDNFTEVVEQVTSVLEENGNVTIDPNVTNIVDYIAGDIINPPAYTPPEELPEPEPEPEPEPVILTYIVALPVEMTLFVGEFEVITSVTAHYSDGSTAVVALGSCTYASSTSSVAIVSNGVITAVAEGTTTITVSYGGKTDTLEVTVSTAKVIGIEVSSDTIRFLEINDFKLFTVIAIYNDGLTPDITSDCAYVIDVGIVEVDEEVGKITPKNFGKDTITVVYTPPGQEIFTDIIEVGVGRVHNATQDEYYETITGAIDHDSTIDFDIIEVAPGTYDGTIIINKALTIKSTDGAMGTIIDGTSTYIVTILHSNVTFEGFTVTNPEYDSTGDVSGIRIGGWNYTPIPENVQILNNIVTQIRSETGSYSSMFGATGINVGTSKNVVVSGNTITDIKNPGSFVGSSDIDHTCGINVWGDPVSGSSRNIVISNNDISDIKYNGIILEGAIDVKIEDNDITGCESGVRVKPREGEISNVQISENDITGCEYGISVVPEAFTLSDLTVNYNNLFGNTEYGVYNITEYEIDATYNWWGAESGPGGDVTDSETGTIADGTGDKVSSNVRFDPWL